MVVQRNAVASLAISCDRHRCPLSMETVVKVEAATVDADVCVSAATARPLAPVLARQPAFSSIVNAAIATVVTVVTAVPCSARSP